MLAHEHATHSRPSKLGYRIALRLETGAEEIAGGACNTLDTIARATWCLAQCQFGFLIRHGMVSVKDEQAWAGQSPRLGKYEQESRRSRA
jgi:hypothetical protein